jgi:intergrase/recombinase
MLLVIACILAVGESFRVLSTKWISTSLGHSVMPTTVNEQSKRLIKKTLQSVTPAFLILSSIKIAPTFAASEDDYIDALATMIEAKVIITPTKQAFTTQAYDKARTNIQYILDQLKLQKKVQMLLRNSIDFCDDSDVIEEAQEAANRLTNTAMQYDSSIYTCVFIPSEDGSIPPSAEKYRTEASNYYTLFLQDLEKLLKLGSDDQLQRAQSLADVNMKSMPKVLFK